MALQALQVFLDHRDPLRIQIDRGQLDVGSRSSRARSCRQGQHRHPARAGRPCGSSSYGGQLGTGVLDRNQALREAGQLLNTAPGESKSWPWHPLYLSRDQYPGGQLGAGSPRGIMRERSTRSVMGGCALFASRIDSRLRWARHGASSLTSHAGCAVRAAAVRSTFARSLPRSATKRRSTAFTRPVVRSAPEQPGGIHRQVRGQFRGVARVLELVRGGGEQCAHRDSRSLPGG